MNVTQADAENVAKLLEGFNALAEATGADFHSVVVSIGEAHFNVSWQDDKYVAWISQ